jgi:hypothetical protein
MTAYGITEALCFGIPSAFIIATAVRALRRRLREMRTDREWAADIARRVRQREYLAWLEEQFDAEGSDAQ